jgi:hypothetical protein
MPIIQVDHLTKEYRLGAMQGIKQAPSAPAFGSCNATDYHGHHKISCLAHVF